MGSTHGKYRYCLSLESQREEQFITYRVEKIKCTDEAEMLMSKDQNDYKNKFEAVTFF